MSVQSKKIREFILSHIEQYPDNIVAMSAKYFSVTRTTIHRHLNTLLKQGEIFKSGTTRNIKYSLKSSLHRQMIYKITTNLSEFSVLQTDFNDIFRQFPENIYDICIYGFTEMFNNAIDHSQGSKIEVKTVFFKEQLIIEIKDNGRGVFQTIRDYFQLNTIHESVLQLSKGKTTIDPVHHTGEGVFFTSRAFDRFEIYANNVYYLRDNKENDWALETLSQKMTGSMIRMTISKNASTNLVELFKRYQDPEDLSFSRTEILVQLSQWGDEPLISRSQAKRITLGLEKFRHVTLDFSNVRLVGQGFIDEMFRVFTQKYPHITLDYVNANSDVSFMIQRGRP